MQKVEGTLTYQYDTHSVHFCCDKLSKEISLVVNFDDKQKVKIPVSFLWDQISTILFNEFGKHEIGHPLHRRSLEAFALQGVKHAIVAALIAT